MPVACLTPCLCCHICVRTSLCAVLQVKDNESLYPAFYKLTDSRSQITSCAPSALCTKPACGVCMPPFLQPSARSRLPPEVHVLQTSLTWCARPCRRSCWTTCSRCAAPARWCCRQRLYSAILHMREPCMPLHDNRWTVSAEREVRSQRWGLALALLSVSLGSCRVCRTRCGARCRKAVRRRCARADQGGDRALGQGGADQEHDVLRLFHHPDAGHRRGP